MDLKKKRPSTLAWRAQAALVVEDRGGGFRYKQIKDEELRVLGRSVFCLHLGEMRCT